MNKLDKTTKIYRKICRDCLAIYLVPVLFYTAQIVVGEVLRTYSATVLGEFAD